MKKFNAKSNSAIFDALFLNLFFLADIKYTNHNIINFKTRKANSSAHLNTNSGKKVTNE